MNRPHAREKRYEFHPRSDPAKLNRSPVLTYKRTHHAGESHDDQGERIIRVATPNQQPHPTVTATMLVMTQARGDDTPSIWQTDIEDLNPRAEDRVERIDGEHPFFIQKIYARDHVVARAITVQGSTAISRRERGQPEDQNRI